MGAQVGAACGAAPGHCFGWLSQNRKVTERPRSSSGSSSTPAKTCSGCGHVVENALRGGRGDALCRKCLRKEDEALLAPLTEGEQRGLDLLADILDTVPWDFWKPGEQPAKLLDWLYLGDLAEAMDFDLLARRGVSAVVNLINWWELTARLPEVQDISSVYASHSVEFLEADSEDRLFFDIVERSWPEAEVFMEGCRKKGQRVLVNCKAGHNRSACVCVCWLIVREGMTLLQAVEWVLVRRGMILSNHGFRLQLVRLALKLGRLGEPSRPQLLTARSLLSSKPSILHGEEGPDRPLLQIISKKRLSLKYDHNSMDLTSSTSTAASAAVQKHTSLRGKSLFTQDLSGNLAQRTLKMDLLACLYHQGMSFLKDYEYTSRPPTVIGSGFSGDVVLCKTRQRTAIDQNRETGIRCVKRFDLTVMASDRLDKLKNEALIYLSLEHPHIARLFDVFEDNKEVALVMQYCSGGTLEDFLKSRGAFDEAEFQRVAVQMLLAMTYIHEMGIVHRDIKPRNWVYEADGRTIKLIDFGFSAKAYLSDHGTDGNEKRGGLLGCMGTLGYLAPEVIQAGISTEVEYTEKCDIWSLGAVFYELLVGQPAFHRDRGQCDGYTEEVVLREIETVSVDAIEQLLESVPAAARDFLRKLMTPDPNIRPSAKEVLQEAYLVDARAALVRPDESLSISTVLDRFRDHGRLSKTSRAWLLAVARSPTYLPWRDFVQLRNTFKKFDARGLVGTVNLDTFVKVVVEEMGLECHEEDAQSLEEEMQTIWASVCGAQESLSYCEFLAVLLPPIEDAFEDVTHNDSLTPVLPSYRSEALGNYTIPEASGPQLSVSCYPSEGLMSCPAAHQWNPSKPISDFIPLLRGRKLGSRVPIFNERVSVQEVVQEMSNNRLRWAVVSYESGSKVFFDYMDINHKLMEIMRKGRRTASEAMKRVVSVPVGTLANCSGHSDFVPMSANDSLRDVLRIIVKTAQDTKEGEKSGPIVHRVPIVSQEGEVLHVFSCHDFLDLALQFPNPSAALKSQSAKTFDERSTILQTSVMTTDPMTAAMGIMDTHHVTVVPATLRELSGDLGGVVASNVISVTDLKLVIMERRPDVLDLSVDQFIAWRQQVMGTVDGLLRRQRLHRFNVVSVDAGDSLYTLAHRLLKSKLQRIFLSSDEIARIVGVVSSRHILIESLDQVL